MSRDPGRPGASRARAGGSARPVGDPPARPAGAPAAHTGPAGGSQPAAPHDGARSAAPPSFAPGTGGGRPSSGPDAVPVGRPGAPGRDRSALGSSASRSSAAPRATAQRTAAPRPVPPRPASYPASPPASSPAPSPAAGGAGRPPAPASRPPAGRPAGSTPPPSSEARTRGPGAGAPPPRLGTATAVGPGRPARRRRLATVAALLVAVLLAWPVGLLVWANGRVQHVDALASTADTPGTTYLLAGSDSRGGDGGIAQDGTEGARTDTIMLLHVPPSGPPALISLPRDTFAEIPGQGDNKLNAAYSWGGAPLLVQTVEGLTGMHVDHYVEVGLDGVARVVDALGGVQLCLDPAVNQVDFPLDDPDSGLVWPAPGCQVADGATSLAFARMRKADREGDIGRAKRQQQLIAALSSSAATPSLAVHPGRQVSLLSAGLGALQVSEGTGVVDLGRLALAFRTATGPEGIRGTPPIADTDHRPGGIGSTVLLDPDTTPGFFADIMNGDLPPGPVGGVPPA